MSNFFETQLQLYVDGGMPELTYLEEIKDLFKDGTVIDVGANIGELTYFFKYKCNARNVVAFEPNPNAFVSLKEKLETVDVTVYQAALSDKTGVDVLHVPFDTELNGYNLGLSTLVPVWLDKIRQQHPNVKDAIQWEIVKRRLDDYSFQNVKLIKIDVEGHESEVINGALDTIKQNKPILVVEIVDNDQVKSDIQALGYDCFWYDREKKKLSKSTKVPTGVYNFIFTPKA